MTELKQIKETIDQIVQMELNFQIEKIILLLSKTYHLDKNDIYSLLKDFDTQLEQKKVTTGQNRIEINKEKCLGKTKYNTQCSRSRQKDSLFCGSHLNKLPYGRVDNPTAEKPCHKKRGRPRKDSNKPEEETN